MTQPLTLPKRRKCRGCQKQKRREKDFRRLPNKTANPFCILCVERKQRQVLDDLGAAKRKASWEVSR